VAFDGFRAQSNARPRGARGLTIVASVALHAALLLAGIAYSFWHVDELSPPAVRVTFMSAPPPPPPPPAGGGGGARKKLALKPKTSSPTKTPDIVQPREIQEPEARPKPEPVAEKVDAPGEHDGVKGGVIGGKVGGTIGGTVGGKIGGTVGGTIGGAGSAPISTKFLSPDLGAGQKQAGENPPFPAGLRRPGAVYHVLAKICVSASGAVDKVVLMKGADPTLDEGVLATVRTWRFRPYLTSGGTAAPFCYPQPFEFRAQ
jgi:periplasmic protein TonB